MKSVAILLQKIGLQGVAFSLPLQQGDLNMAYRTHCCEWVFYGVRKKKILNMQF